MNSVRIAKQTVTLLHILNKRVSDNYHGNLSSNVFQNKYMRSEALYN